MVGSPVITTISIVLLGLMPFILLRLKEYKNEGAQFVPQLEEPISGEAPPT